VSLALGLALGATLGIPRLSVRSHAVGVGTHRLARALGARRQRLAIGAQPRLGRGAALRAELVALDVVDTRFARMHRASTFVTRATRPRATRTTGTGTTAAIVPRSTTATAAIIGATRATAAGTRATLGAAASTARTAAFERARRGRQLPADPGARHLATSGPIVAVTLVVFVRAGL
jgi:hypothetical protein